jgi:hypothetical protein
MFDGQKFSAPFFIQYGPGNSHTADHADKFLYAVSNDGYAYDGNYVLLGRVPLDKVQRRGAWRFYHARTGRSGHRERHWSKALRGATHVLTVKHGISQPAIQYYPALRLYLLLTFHFKYSPRFPYDGTTAYSSFTFYKARHPWGPWRRFFVGPTQRSLWCGTHCSRSSTDRFGLFDPALVQKFAFDRPLRQQTILTTGDWKNKRPPWANVPLTRLRAIPLTLITR